MYAIRSYYDGIEIVELRVGHVGLGEQHVHVTGHAAGDRMDGEFDLLVALDELLRQLPDFVLRRITSYNVCYTKLLRQWMWMAMV